MSRRRIKRYLLVLLVISVIAAVLGGTGTFASFGDAQRSPSPGHFSLSGSVTGLAPGAPSTLVVTADSAVSAEATITSLTVSVSSAAPNCSALSYLRLDHTAFTGNPPTVTVTDFSPAWVVPSGGIASTSIPIELLPNAPKVGCQSVTFPFDYNATATYGTATDTLSISGTPKRQTVTTKIEEAYAVHATKTTVHRGTARFRITVSNPGDVTLQAVTVTDRRASRCARTFGTLAPGASRTYTCEKPAVRKSFMNVAVVTGESAQGAGAKARATFMVTVRTNRTVTLTLPDVLFASDQSTLRATATPKLAFVLRVLKATFPTGHITVTGYTDNVGTAAYNLVLSKRRATTVADWLEQRGVPAKRITIAWKGETHPIASNATAAGRENNRRVTITIHRGH